MRKAKSDWRRSSLSGPTLLGAALVLRKHILGVKNGLEGLEQAHWTAAPTEQVMIVMYSAHGCLKRCISSSRKAFFSTSVNPSTASKPLGSLATCAPFSSSS